VILAIALLAGQAAWMIRLRGSRILDAGTTVIGGQVALGVVLLAIAVLLCTTPRDAIVLRRRTSHQLILAGAALLQALAIILLLPALSEDLVRYRIEGRMWLSGVSPYATSPAQWQAGGGPTDAVDRMVSHPEMQSIYPPVAQIVFAASRAIELSLAPAKPDATPDASPQPSTWRASLPALPWHQRGIVLRIIYAACALAAMAVVLAILRLRGQSPWWAVLLAWNPLLVIETGGMGHQDALGALLVMLMLLSVQKRTFGRATLALALACAVKPPIVVLLPFLWRASLDPDRSRALIRRHIVPVAFAASTLVLLLPVLWQDGHHGLLASARIYSQSWEANGSLFELRKWIAPPGDGPALQAAKDAGRQFAVIALLAVAAGLWLKRASIEQAGYALLLVMLLTSPVVYPWYLVWPLAFVPLLGGRYGWAVLVWSGTVAVSYLMWHQPLWAVPGKWALVEYLPVYLAFVAEFIGIRPTSIRASSAGAESQHPPCEAPLRSDPASAPRSVA
jgi:hypothetical protein